MHGEDSISSSATSLPLPLLIHMFLHMIQGKRCVPVSSPHLHAGNHPMHVSFFHLRTDGGFYSYFHDGFFVLMSLVKASVMVIVFMTGHTQSLGLVSYLGPFLIWAAKKHSQRIHPFIKHENEHASCTVYIIHSKKKSDAFHFKKGK